MCSSFAWPFALLLLAGCGRFTADDGRAVLVGQVLTADSAPVPGARVLLITGRSPELEVRTGADGRFTLEGSSGEHGLLVLTQGDRGAWRGGLNLRAAGTTDVGTLEEGPVWAHPEVLWLRGTGFDEQLTAEGTLSHLGGGQPGQPLFVSRQRTLEIDLLRIDDDGAAHVLATRPWLLAGDAGLSISFQRVNAFTVFQDEAGRWVAFYQEGGSSLVTAQGAQLFPTSRLTWLDGLSGASLLDVAVPASVDTVSVVPERGALLFGGPGAPARFASLRSRAVLELSADVPRGPPQRAPDGVWLLDITPVGARVVQVTDTGEVRPGPAVPLPEQDSFSTFTVVGGVPLALWRGPDAASVVRFDPVTRAPTLERLARTAHGTALGDRVSFIGPYPVCAGDDRPVLVDRFAQGFEAFRLGPSTTTRRTRLLPNLTSSFERYCADDLADALVWRPTGQLEQVRFRGEAVTRELLPQGTEVRSQQAAAQLIFSRREGTRVSLFVAPPLGLFSEAKRLGHLPFLVSPSFVGTGPEWVVATGLSGPGVESRLFRIPIPRSTP